MKLPTYNSLNFNKWFSNSTIEFLVSSRESSLLSVYKKLIYYFNFHQYTRLKKIRLKNNLSKSNHKLRDLITKKI